ncbi:MAG: hypothetical protein ABR573_08345 [Candidatus Dormibacteria bacterium]
MAVRELMIEAALRGRGFGRAVMVEAVALLRERGIAEVSPEVVPDNGRRTGSTAASDS